MREAGSLQGQAPCARDGARDGAGDGGKEKSHARHKPIAIVLKGYPRLSETFIAQEIYGLEQRGLPLTLVSMRQPTDTARHPVVDEIAASVTYLPEYLHHAPWRVMRALVWALRHAHFFACAALFWRDFVRDTSFNRIRRLGQALVFAREFAGKISHIHAHFIHTPASVARYASVLMGLSFSVSAHAKDIWITPDWDLAEKLRDAAFAVTCTRTGAERLGTLAPRAKPVALAYHGLDFGRFPAPPDEGAQEPSRDGTNPALPVRLLCVGRAVAKKGLDVLLDALALLPPHLHWTLTHIGGGALDSKLKDQARALHLTDRITFMGARAQPEILAAYRVADLFVLPCKIAHDGDRDGLPNVLMEAMSQRRACLSTFVPGVEELIAHGHSGYLVAPNDARAFTDALALLVSDIALRKTLADNGFAHVRATCDCARTLDGLAKRLEQVAFARAYAEESP